MLRISETMPSTEENRSGPIGELLWKGKPIASLRKDNSDFPWHRFKVVKLLGPTENHVSLATSTAEILNNLGSNGEIETGERSNCHALDWFSFEFRWPGQECYPVRAVFYEPENEHIRFRGAPERVEKDKD